MAPVRADRRFEIPGFVLRDDIRCPDCDIRGDLDLLGRPYPKRKHRVGQCRTCTDQLGRSRRGTGRIRVYGVDRLDPMARRK